MVSRRQFVVASAAALAGVRPCSAGGEHSATVYRKALPLMCETDVFIAGGGPAGIAAALAASRSGARVFLAEASGAFGGAATAAYVPALATFSDGRRIVVGGIGREIRERVSQSLPLEGAWTMLDLEELKRVYDRLLVASGTEFSFFTNVVDVIAHEGHVESVVVASKRGLLAVRANVYIDCTGDGDLCAFGGGAFEKGDEKGGVMPTTLCSVWAGIDFSADYPWPQSLLPKAIADGVFSVPDLHLPGVNRRPNGSVVGGGNVGHVFGVDPTDERSLTKAMVEARRRMVEYVRFYREYVKGHEKAELVGTAPCLGVRESRRIVCDYRLTVDDFLRRATFDDQIGRYCYPIDLHASTSDEKAFSEFEKEYREKYRYNPGESYGIPFRALIPRSFDNVLVAGRCIGSDRKMQASVRVMPGCFITGQAAGTAAALAVAKRDVRSVNIDRLREILKSSGAVL